MIVPRTEALSPRHSRGTESLTPTLRAFSVILFGLCSLLPFSPAQAQETPLISGGVGFFTSTNGGNTTYIPTITPLLVAPLGGHLQIESKANLLELFVPTGKGYDTFHFVALSYLQGDYIANPHVTVVGGLFLSPFGTYTERLSPIWINNLQDSPLIYSIGTGTGTSLGGMLRGNAYSDGKISIDYAVYYSAHSNNEQFLASRSARAFGLTRICHTRDSRSACRSTGCCRGVTPMPLDFISGGFLKTLPLSFVPSTLTPRTLRDTGLRSTIGFRISAETKA